MKAVLFALAASAAAALAPLAAAAAEAEGPAGPVVLTVAGDIDKTNRPPFDAGRDAFLEYHERAFDKAFAFDRAMLAAFGAREAEIDLGNGPRVFSGPRLSDVLGAVGCRGPLTTLALDGFGSDISEADRESRDWILATAMDGRPFGLGGRGPLWLVFDPPGARPATMEEQGMWPWALFFIRCGKR